MGKGGREGGRGVRRRRKQMMGLVQVSQSCQVLSLFFPFLQPFFNPSLLPSLRPFSSAFSSPVLNTTQTLYTTSPLNRLYSKKGLADRLSYSCRRRARVECWGLLGCRDTSCRGNRAGSTAVREREENTQWNYRELLRLKIGPDCRTFRIYF